MSLDVKDTGPIAKDITQPLGAVSVRPGLLGRTQASALRQVEKCCVVGPGFRGLQFVTLLDVKSSAMLTDLTMPGPSTFVPPCDCEPARNKSTKADLNAVDLTEHNR